MDDIKTKKSEVRMLHMYHDLMNLYGDWANVAVLARLLNARGVNTAVDYMSVGDDIDFRCYDFVYIGSGTERSQKACMRDLARHKQALLGIIRDGTYILATGNSHELFGYAITDAGGERYEALGLLDFETVQNSSRITGDCISKAAALVPERDLLAVLLQDRLIGFINRAGCGQNGSVERPFITELGPGASDTIKESDTARAGKINSPGTNSEGIVYRNLLGTYMTGPILTRNPPLLKYYANRLCPESHDEGTGGDTFFDYQEAAYRAALKELSARIEN